MAPKRGCQSRPPTLEDRQKELQRQLEAVTRQLRTEKERSRKQLAHLLRSAKYKTMRSLMVLTDGDVRIIERFAQTHGIAPKHWDEILSALERWHGTWSGTLEEYIGAATRDPHQRSSLKKATSFLESEKLERWITQNNVTKGITPSSQSCIAQVRKEMDLHPPVVEASLPPRRRKYAFQWLRRWRRRWGCSIQALPSLQTLSAAEKYSKAGGTKK